MNISETAEIVRRVALVEGRPAPDQMVPAWHDLIGHLDFEVANKATTLALQDHNVVQVLPKSVLSKVPSAIAELNRLLKHSELDESTWRSDPEPVCSAHMLNITRCDPCCEVLARQSRRLDRDQLHEWAVANVYVKEELPF